MYFFITNFCCLFYRVCLKISDKFSYFYLQVADLGKQVTSLVMEVEAARGGRPSLSSPSRDGILEQHF
jgi:hypothetical protein